MSFPLPRLLSAPAMCAVLLATAPLPAAAEACDFDCTLQRHLDAIQRRDYPAFEATLTRGKRLTFILPNGKLSEDAADYRRQMQEWFADDGWRLEYKVISVERSAQMGNALLLVSYDDRDADGKPYHIDHYLSLLFKREGRHWRLVHDQNTRTTLGQ